MAQVQGSATSGNAQDDGKVRVPCVPKQNYYAGGFIKMVPVAPAISDVMLLKALSILGGKLRKSYKI